MAFKTRKIYTPAQKKEALILNLDPGLRNSLAARISPLDLGSPVVSYEYLVAYFDERYNSGLTESQAEQEFDNCYQGDLPIDDWVEKLNYLVFKCGWGEKTDKALKKQIIKGCSNDSCRAELVKLAPQTSKEAIRMYKQILNSLKDLESVNKSHQDGRVTPCTSILTVHSQPNTDADGRRSAGFPRSPSLPRNTGSWSRSQSQTRARNQQRSRGSPRGNHPARQPASQKHDWRGGCLHCGGEHDPLTCPHLGTTCFNCSRVGHTVRACPFPATLC